ncbi:MAG: DUF262 domain-containing protein [Hassallia sp. WJT32-NPBG1]|jgi:uncharacterized protein with ParB-like and HNH nuclease domain|nr:DUF262 domain-containing protein [Hassallia sp. WJT32-NPBG1]
MGKNGIATNKKVLDLFNMMKSGSLILAPSFQRKLVWNDAHKEKFIETILLKLPFPEIYLADGEIDLDTQTSKTLVVDGQQRLSTIYQFVTASPEFTIKNISRFENLSTREKTDFFDYTVVVRDLGRIPESEIREVFKRINSVQYALNAIEINNSLYEGEFITTAKDIIENNLLFKRLEVFSEGEFSRMKDLEYVLLIMSIIEEGGYFTSDKEIRTYVEKYNNEYLNKDLMINNFHEVSKLIIACNLPPDSLLIKKSSLLTLIIELIKIKNKYTYLPEEENLIAALNSLEKELYNNRKQDVYTNIYAQYYYYTHQGTASRKGRNVRGQLINRILEEIMN